MKLKDILEAVEGKVIAGEELLSEDVKSVIASDMMSDVLRYSRHGALLITGNSNIQSLRTALIAELRGVVFVRGKEPDSRTRELARENGIFVALTNLDTFEACGTIYQKMEEIDS